MKKLATIILYQEKIQKVSFCYTVKYKYKLHFKTKFSIPLAFIDSLNVAWLNMIETLMMLAKLAILCLLNTKYFAKIKVMMP